VVAWAPDRARDDWLGHVPADTRAHYADALTAIHERGFAVEIAAPTVQLRELADLLANDASARAALDRLADELATHEEFLVVDIDPDRDYPVNVVNAPVFDHTGNVILVLSLTGFARTLRGHEVLAAGDALVAATSRLTDALSPTPSSRTSRS
jgi:DNA-binding IclR family transcriptional regulator